MLSIFRLGNRLTELRRLTQCIAPITTTTGSLFLTISPSDSMLKPEQLAICGDAILRFRTQILDALGLADQPLIVGALRIPTE